MHAEYFRCISILYVFKDYIKHKTFRHFTCLSAEQRVNTGKEKTICISELQIRAGTRAPLALLPSIGLCCKHAPRLSASIFPAPCQPSIAAPKDHPPDTLLISSYHHLAVRAFWKLPIAAKLFFTETQSLQNVGMFVYSRGIFWEKKSSFKD